MPTYEYQCLNCGSSFEHFQSISSEPLERCSLCGGALRRRISGGAGVIVKTAGRSASGAAGPRGAADKGSCYLQREGKTCCGRAQRCNEPPCDR